MSAPFILRRSVLSGLVSTPLELNGWIREPIQSPSLERLAPLEKSQLTQLARVIDIRFCFWLAHHKNDHQNISSRKRRVMTKRDGSLRNHHRGGLLLVLMWDQDSTRPPFLFVSVNFGMDSNRRAVGYIGNFKGAAPVSSLVKWK